VHGYELQLVYPVRLEGGRRSCGVRLIIFGNIQWVGVPDPAFHDFRKSAYGGCLDIIVALLCSEYPAVSPAGG